MDPIQKIKILYLFTSGTFKSANNKKWFPLYFKTKNVDVSFLIKECNDDEKQEFLKKFNDAFNVIYFKPLDEISKQPLRKKLKYFRTIARKIDETAPDIIHINGLFYSYILMPLLFIKSKPKYVFNIWGSDYYEDYFNNLKKKILFKWLVKKANLIWTNWYALGDDLKAQFPKYIDKIRTIPWGVESDLFKPASTSVKRRIKKEFKLNNEMKLMLYTRSFYPFYFHHRLIKALKYLKLEINYKLIFHNNNPNEKYIEKLRKTINENNMNDKIQFSHKTLSDDEMKALYELADLTFSLTENEQFSRTISEAILTNTHLIVNDIRPYRYLVNMYDFKINMVSKKDDQELAKKIEYCLTSGKPNWDYEKQVIKRIFNFETKKEYFLNIYKELIHYET